MRRQPATDKMRSLDAPDDPVVVAPPEPVRVDVRLITKQPARHHVSYTRAGDRSTFERDFAEVRLFKRIGGAVVFGLLVAFAIFQNHPH